MTMIMPCLINGTFAHSVDLDQMLQNATSYQPYSTTRHPTDTGHSLTLDQTQGIHQTPDQTLDIHRTPDMHRALDWIPDIYLTLDNHSDISWTNENHQTNVNHHQTSKVEKAHSSSLRLLFMDLPDGELDLGQEVYPLPIDLTSFYFQGLRKCFLEISIRLEVLLAALFIGVSNRYQKKTIYLLFATG